MTNQQTTIEYPVKAKKGFGNWWIVVDRNDKTIVKAKCEGEAEDIAEQMNAQKESEGK